MTDFLKENTWCSLEQYKWELSVAQIRLMSFDFTHIEHLDTDKAKKPSQSLKNATVINGGDDLKNLNDFGIPIIKKPKKTEET